MVISPTYLAQRTRTCKCAPWTTYYWIADHNSTQLGRRTAASFEILPRMATGREEFLITLQKSRADQTNLGSRDPNDVFPQHARLEDQDKSPARI